MVVAIDGPSGVGKSTVASCAAQRTGFSYLNSGSFYRGITKTVLDSNLNPEDENDILKAAAACDFQLREGEILLNGQPLLAQSIQNDRVDRWVAVHSSIPKVRDLVNQKLRGIAQNRDIIVEGRDIGTVVFPQAELKIYLDANPGTRARRRYHQGVSQLEEEELRRRLEERDTLDRSKPFGRLEQAGDSQYIDTSDLTIDRVCAKVVDEILKKAKSSGSRI